MHAAGEKDPRVSISTDDTHRVFRYVSLLYIRHYDLEQLSLSLSLRGYDLTLHRESDAGMFGLLSAYIRTYGKAKVVPLKKYVPQD